MSLRESDVFKAPRVKRRKPEKDRQKAIVAYLLSHGWLVAETDAGAAYHAGGYSGSHIPAGWPDLTCLAPGGRFVGVEVKAATGRQSPVQVDMQQRIERLGGLYVLARSVDDVVAALESQP